jgi:polygalacturonase
MITRKTIAFIMAVTIGGINGSQAQPSVKDMSWYIQNAPFKMPDIARADFPAKDFRITDYGAIGDGHTLCTEAIRKAVAACSAAGGGHVIVPAGRWLTDPIELLGNVDLHLEKEALVLFNPDHSAYPTLSASPNDAVMPPVYSLNQENIALTGEGTLDGAGETWRPVKKEKQTAEQWRQLLSSGVLSPDGKIWWPNKDAMEHPNRRPVMVSFVNCRRILVQGVLLRNSPKFVFYPSRCTDLTLDHVKIFNDWWAQNGDGIDISACKRVIVYACTVNAGDDGICMKSSGAGPDGPALEDVIIAGCTVLRAHGGFVIGSNTDGGMHDIFVSDCTFAGTDIGLRFKSNMGRGGLVNDIFIRDIAMQNIVREAVLFDTYYEDVPAGSTRKNAQYTDKTPEFRDFHISRIDCQGAATAISITGLPQMPVSNIFFDSVSIRSTKGLVATQARNIDLQQVKLDASEKPVLQTDRTAEVRVH